MAAIHSLFMKTLFVVFRSPVWLLAAAFVCGGAGQSRAQLADPHALPSIAVSPKVQPIVQADAKAPVLAGQLVTPVVKKAANGNGIRVKTGVFLNNTGNKAAKDVTVTAYLSDDGTLSDDDTKLITLNLADYNDGSSKLAKGEAMVVPLHYKVPAGIASFLVGKYLIFVIGASNATASTPVVFGPIALP